MVLKHTVECWRVRKIHASGAATLASGPGSIREKQKRTTPRCARTSSKDEASAISQPIDLGRKKDGGLTMVLNTAPKLALMRVRACSEQ
jgi:hypothetical protein